MVPHFHTSQASVVVMGNAEDETLGSLGENATLARILPLLPSVTQAEIGPGDDSAVINLSEPRIVISTDMMIEGPDFQWSWSDPEQVGYKAIASNAADIAAMGAVVVSFQIALAAPKDTPVAVLERLARGCAAGIAALTPGAGVSGGDLSHSSVFTLAVTVVGDLQGRRPTTRDGAKVGDVVAVAGELGLSHQGYRELLEARGDAQRIQALKATSKAVAHHLAPTPPIGLGVVASAAGATALMDISDGLVLDATRMAHASGVSIELQPLDDNALVGGEDHGLLACFPPDTPIPQGFRTIGRVVPSGEKPVLGAGYDIPDVRGGWDPFQDFSAP